MNEEPKEDKKNEVTIEAKRSIGGPGITIIDSKITLKSLDSLDDLIVKALEIQNRLGDMPDTTNIKQRAVKNEPIG